MFGSLSAMGGFGQNQNAGMYDPGGVGQQGKYSNPWWGVNGIGRYMQKHGGQYPSNVVPVGGGGGGQTGGGGGGNPPPTGGGGGGGTNPPPPSPVPWAFPQLMTRPYQTRQF